MNPSTAIAEVVVDELAALGVTDAVLCPGSRNAPLSLALHRADNRGALRLHVRIDERTAGFLALGLAKASGRPVAVVTTSGTAVANLHPAVVEADLSGVPLIVLSADRPPWMRDVGANQVIDQVRLFGTALRFFHEFETPVVAKGSNARWRSMVCRAIAQASGAAGFPGPVQLNLCLADPLLPKSAELLQANVSEWPEPLAGRPGGWTAIERPAAPSGPGIPPPEPGERALFLADLTHPLAGQLAAAGHPVIAEAGGAAGEHVLSAGFHLLGNPGFLAAYRPDRVIVLGRPTLHRQVTALLTDPAVHVDMVAPAVGWRGVAGNVRRLAPHLAAVAPAAESSWLRQWRSADAMVAGAVGEHIEQQALSASPALARTVAALLPNGCRLIIGSSQPARDISVAVQPREGLRTLANRGAAGIDGTVSTAIGAALVNTGRTVAYLGDLTLLHDITGLIIGPAEPRPELTVVVSNNDGGGIFGTLEPGDPAHSGSFERVFGTPHGTDLASLVRGTGHRHVAVAARDELAAAFAAATGITVIEVATDRFGLRSLLADIREITASALAQLG